MLVSYSILYTHLTSDLYGIAPSGSYGARFACGTRGVGSCRLPADAGGGGGCVDDVLNDGGSGAARGSTSDVRGGTRGSVAIGESAPEKSDLV